MYNTVLLNEINFYQLNRASFDGEGDAKNDVFISKHSAQQLTFFRVESLCLVQNNVVGVALSFVSPLFTYVNCCLHNKRRRSNRGIAGL